MSSSVPCRLSRSRPLSGQHRAHQGSCQRGRREARCNRAPVRDRRRSAPELRLDRCAPFRRPVRERGWFSVPRPAGRCRGRRSRLARFHRPHASAMAAVTAGTCEIPVICKGIGVAYGRQGPQCPLKMTVTASAAPARPQPRLNRAASRRAGRRARRPGRAMVPPRRLSPVAATYRPVPVPCSALPRARLRLGQEPSRFSR
jgi:hypothetical protein